MSGFDVTDFTHIVAHLLIFAAYLAAVVRVPPAFKQLIRIRGWTMVAGGGFFLLCALTHLSLALDAESHWFFEITNHLQAVAIISFLILLSQDLNAAMQRLRWAFKAIRVRRPDEGDEIVAFIVAALQGHDR